MFESPMAAFTRRLKQSTHWLLLLLVTLLIFLFYIGFGLLTVREDTVLQWTTLTDLGIQVILPPEPYLQADLPVLSPTIAGIIRDSGELMILDVGGNDAGATVLSALADAFTGKKVHMLQVVNPLRPQTNTVSGCLRLRNEIEKAAQLTITGLIGNANLVDETSVEDIYSGYEFVQTVSQKSGLPLAFITVSQELLPQIDLKRFACAVLPIARQLVPPWMKVSEFRN